MSIDNQTVKDFREGDIVQHVFHGRWGVVTKVGRKYITVRLTVGGTHKFHADVSTSQRKVATMTDYESMIVWSVSDDFKGWAPCACPGCPDEPIASYISVEREFRGNCPVKIEVVNVPVCEMHADFAEEVLSDLAVVVGIGGATS